MGRRCVTSCILSSLASLLGLLNPLLAGVAVNRLLRFLSLPAAIPAFVGIICARLMRMGLRSASSRILGTNGRNPRAPLIFLQNRIGKGLWWLEPMLRSWGIVGMIVRHLHKGVTARIATGVAYYVTDIAVALTAGFIYYFTRSYLLSLLACLLPALEAAPWLTEKTTRFLHLKKMKNRFTHS